MRSFPVFFPCLWSFPLENWQKISGVFIKYISIGFPCSQCLPSSSNSSSRYVRYDFLFQNYNRYCLLFYSKRLRWALHRLLWSALKTVRHSVWHTVVPREVGCLFLKPNLWVGDSNAVTDSKAEDLGPSSGSPLVLKGHYFFLLHLFICKIRCLESTASKASFKIIFQGF